MKPPAMAEALMGLKKKSKKTMPPSEDSSEDMMGGMDMDDEDEEEPTGISVTPAQVNAARAVRAAIKSGGDKELAQALCGFYKLDDEDEEY